MNNFPKMIYKPNGNMVEHKGHRYNYKVVNNDFELSEALKDGYSITPMQEDDIEASKLNGDELIGAINDQEEKINELENKISEVQLNAVQQEKNPEETEQQTNELQQKNPEELEQKNPEPKRGRPRKAK